MNLLHSLMILLTIEKLFQHLLTAVFFVVSIPGIGTPDIGTVFAIDTTTMALLNILVFILFVAGLYAFLLKKAWGIFLIAGMALADIVLEFLFHGFGHFTVSVIVSSLIILVFLVLWKNHRATRPAVARTE